MNDFKWCHGPRCHTFDTQDRVRGTKGNKVLRTRKIKHGGRHTYYRTNKNEITYDDYFCSQSCLLSYISTNLTRIVQIAPRLNELETPIDDPKQVKHTSDYTYPDGTQHTWTSTQITKKGVDTTE